MATAVKTVPAKVHPKPEHVFNRSNMFSHVDLTAMPVVAQRVLFVAMCQVQLEKVESLEVQMDIGEILRACDMPDNVQSYDRVRASVLWLKRYAFDVTTFTDETGEDDWEIFGLLAYAKKTKKTLTMRFEEEVRPFLLELKNRFAQISIKDYSQLQGRHSLRLYELIMAQAGHKGKNGNPPGCWFLTLDVQEIKRLLAVGPNEYQLTSKVRVSLVDKPIQEINSKDLGFKVEVEYNRRGKTLEGFTFRMKEYSRKDPKIVNPKPATKTEQDAQSLRDKYPEKWAELYHIAASQGTLGLTEVVQVAAWEADADIALEAWAKANRPRRKPNA